ncbi:MAG TPA: alpha/beta hydrolase [Acidimicrobiales bacterium]|nr:alpha/beta hydrolase [Acidimicrobiales bacterium]
MPHPPGMHVTDHHARAGGLLVVLVHGSLARGTTFTRVVRRLDDMHVLTYDRRGYGRSRQMPLGVLADHVADLVSLVGEGPAVVVGHSYGGDVALGAALASPGRVIAVGAYEPPLSWLQWWPRRARSAADADPARFAEGFFRRMVGDDAWERVGDRTRSELEADGPALRTELTSLRSAGPPFDVRSMAIPAVFGRGSDSRWHHRRSVDELVATVPGARMVEITGAAHGAHLTHPAAFADFVRAAVPVDGKR